MVAVALFACGGDGAGDSNDGTDDTGAIGIESTTSAPVAGPTTTATVLSSTTAATNPEEAAVVAYQRGWDVFFAALNPPDVESPSVRAAFVGTALEDFLDSIGTSERTGQRTEGSMQTSPTVVSANETDVVLTDCATETSTTYDEAGGVVESGTFGPFNYTVRVVHQGDAWQVAEIQQQEDPCSPA